MAKVLKVDDEWRVESDLHHLTEAAKIRQDPERMKKVRALAKKKLAEVAEVAKLAADGKTDQ